MHDAAKFFTEEQKTQIERAVAAAEAKTAAEIVPVIASSSGRYDRAEDLVGLWCGMILMMVAWYVYPTEIAPPGSWGFAWNTYQILVLLAAVVVGFVGGAIAGSKIWTLRQLFTPRNHMREEVYERAHQAFFDTRVHETAGQTGILLYISLYERMAAVIADNTVHEKLGQTALDDLCASLTAGLAKGDPTAALCAAIENAGKRLAAILPPAANDTNEISNKLVIFN
jgi:putative membrane protein